MPPLMEKKDMYIAPNSTIRLLRNVRLEPDYVNTIYFASLAAQTSYFIGKTKYTLTSQSYQRANKGIIRVNYKAEDLYDCNYLMFQNTSFGNKWFYGFITSIDYINNVTADVHYQIDEMQTWLKDIIFSMCFVEREHSGSDAIGDNIIPEAIETGELVFNQVNGKAVNGLSDALGKYFVVIATSDFDEDPQTHNDGAQGRIYDGVYGGATLSIYPCRSSAVDNINDRINQFEQMPDAVLGLYLIPVCSMPPLNNSDEYRGYPDSGTFIDSTNSAWREVIEGTALQTSDTIDGHIVRNNKLFTYPYNFIHIDNANGRELNLRYEFFTDSNGLKNYKPQFLLYSNINMPVTSVIRPRNYKGGKQTTDIDSGYITSESIDLTDYPMCSWNMDSWKAWVAQNTVPESASIIGKGMGAGLAAGAVAAGIMSGGTLLAAGAVVAGVSSVTALLSRIYKASIQADVCKGSLNNGNINMASHKHNFFISRMSVNKQMAEIIDDYFDKFGYATNRVKVPNVHSRPAWNYVKTIECSVDGNIPADAKKIIDGNMNRGITFWHNGDQVGNYSQNNAPQ